MSTELSLPPRPNLERYKKVAKDLQFACRSSNPDAIRHWAARSKEAIAHLQGIEITGRGRTEIADDARRLAQRWQEFRASNEPAERCSLASAQLFLARAHGFASWPKFSRHVEQQSREIKPAPKRPQSSTESVDAGGISLPLDIVLPEHAAGIVLLASGNVGRHHPWNRYLADVLHRAGLGTIRADLLTEDEEIADIGNETLRFDIDLLSGRIAALTGWIEAHPNLNRLSLGYIGADTGAAAALRVATDRRHEVRAAVSLGGRPDLTGSWLGYIRTPTLFITGNANPFLLGLTRFAGSVLPRETECALEVIDGASHALEEEHALHKAASLATRWFTRHLLPQSEETNGQ